MNKHAVLASHILANSSVRQSLLIGADADIAAWYNAQAGTPTLRDHDLTYTDLGRILGPVRIEHVRTAAEQSSIPRAKHLVKMIDAAASLPLQAPGNEAFLQSLAADNQVLTAGEVQTIMSLALQPHTLAETVFGQSINADDVSTALKPHRVGGTSELVPGSLPSE